MNEGPSILPGTWHCTYAYESSSRGEALTDERDIDLHWKPGSRLAVQSSPSSPSRLTMDLLVEGRTATGTWRERTDPSGYYKGAVFTGAVQLIIAEDNRSMSGRWVGHSRDMSEVNTGTWTLTLAR